MIAFDHMLVPAATQAGIKVPENLEEFEVKDFPHWHVFCCLQLGSAMPYPGAHFDNAKIIVSISEEDIMTISAQEIISKGFSYGYCIP